MRRVGAAPSSGQIDGDQLDPVLLDLVTAAADVADSDFVGTAHGIPARTNGSAAYRTVASPARDGS